MGRLAWTVLVVPALMIGRVASADPEATEKLALVESQLAKNPSNALLYVARAEIARLQGRWEAAFADLDRAAEIDPALTGLDRARAEVLLEAGRPREAVEALDRHLDRAPRDTVALAARAHAHAALGDRQAAIRDLDRSIADAKRPPPELYIDRARLLVELAPEKRDEAIRGLDDGLRRLGPLPALAGPAIEIELARKRYDAALARIDALILHPGNHAKWLARKGEILLEAGREAEARSAFVAALTEIDAKPAHRRNVRAVQDLEREVRTNLDRLARADDPANPRSPQ